MIESVNVITKEAEIKYIHFTNLTTSLLKNRGFQFKELGTDHNFPIILATKKALISNAKKKLIIADAHGNENLSVYGLLSYLLTESLPLDQTVSLICCLNPTGHILRTRLDFDKLNSNRGYSEKDDHKSNATRAILANQYLIFDLAQDGLLTLHEDPDAGNAYIYTQDKDMAQEARELINKVVTPDLKIASKKQLYGLDVVDPNDKVFDNCVIIEGSNESLERWIYEKQGIKCFTGEIPGKLGVSPQTRINAHKALISAFIRQ